MSTFSVPVVTIDGIEPIPGADKIELAVIKGYRSIVAKNSVKVGDVAVYIPEQSIVPEAILEAMELTGKLAGGKKNRVKAARFLGVLSQGLLVTKRVYGVVTKEDLSRYTVGTDLAETLGVTKYEEPIPASMAGEVYNAGQPFTVAYDIENIKNYPGVIQDGEIVVMTEKTHGTFTGIGILPRGDWDDKHFLGRFVVFSKGLGARGLCFKDVEANTNNIYVRTLLENDIFQKLSDLQAAMEEEHGFDVPMFLLGETFGAGVQDLTYGQIKPQFRLFDVCVGYRGEQHYFDFDSRKTLANHLGIPMVPVLYHGPFSQEVLNEHTNGKETISGTEAHTREGVVVTNAEERYAPDLGRVILKSISADYLLRKGKTTELQ